MRPGNRLLGVGVASVILSMVFVAVYYLTGIMAQSPSSVNNELRPVLHNTGAGIQFQLIRHATMVIAVDGKKILVDPMLGEQGTEDPYPLTSNRVKNPTAPLPVNVESLLSGIDAVLVTHTHPDHFDQSAVDLLPKNVHILCRAVDADFFTDKGFNNAEVVQEKTVLGDVSFSIFFGNHGDGVLRELMGGTAIWVIESKGYSVMITGDALLDDLLTESLRKTNPDAIIAFSGAASFLFGKPITLDAESIVKMATLMPESQIFAVHMDAINHCHLTRSKFEEYLVARNLENRIVIPEDGEVIQLK